MKDELLHQIDRLIIQTNAQLLENSGESHSEESYRNYLFGWLESLEYVRDMVDNMGD